MLIKIDNELAEKLTNIELQEIMNILASYQLKNPITTYSSRTIELLIVLLLKDQPTEDKGAGKKIKPESKNKESRSEINRQNVMKRWAKKNEENNISNLNISETNTNIDTNTNTDTNIDTNTNTNTDTNNTNDNFVLTIDNKEKNIQNIIQNDTKFNTNINTNNDTKTNSCNIAKDSYLQKQLDKFLEYKTKPETIKNSVDAIDNKVTQLSDNIKINKDDKNPMRSIGSVLSGIKFDVKQEPIQNTKQNNFVSNCIENDSQERERKQEKERSKEKEIKKEKEYNNIYINNNIYNNLSSLERGCGGKPFLNEESGKLEDVRVVESEVVEGEIVVDDIKPVSTAKREKKFTPPTQEQVEAYCREKGLILDAEHWINYYEASDWKVKSKTGMTQMKNWKQAVLTWHNNNKFKNNAVVLNTVDNTVDQQILKHVETVDKNTELVLSEATTIVPQQSSNTDSQRKKNILSDEEVISYCKNIFGIADKYSFAVRSQTTPKTEHQKAVEPLLKNFVNKGINVGGNLIYHGAYGTGKTFYSILTANTCFQYKRISGYVYIKLSQLLTGIKNEFNTDKRLIYDEAVSADLLILDEFGQGVWSEFDKNTIINLIDDRYSNDLSTIFVTNLSRYDFFKRLDPSSASRLSSNSLFFDFGNTDLRNTIGVEHETVQA